MDPVAVVVRKVGVRLIWFLILLYFFSVLDRVNVGFAALSMNRALGLTSEMFGVGATVFLVGYVLFEIPSNVLLVRTGARRWLARIAFTWGAATALMTVVNSPFSFYVMRFLVGAAEAGCLPGILYFMTLWFPQSYRGRYNALFLLSIPLTNALSAPISAALLGLDGTFGLTGWKWLFLMEGLCSAALGLATWRYLDDSPATAAWLSPDERATLQLQLDAERPHRPGGRPHSVLHGLTNPLILLLAVAYTGINLQLNTAAFWLPQIFRSFNLSTWEVAASTATAFACGGVAMYFWGRHSDRSNERLMHVVLAVLLSTAGWATAAYAPSYPILLVGVCVAAAGFFSATVVFWTIPVRLLGGASAAAGIALISAIGGLGSAGGAYVFGRLRDSSGQWTQSLLSVAMWTLVAPLLLIILRRRIEFGEGKR
jgi:sugar phosphate permease